MVLSLSRHNCCVIYALDLPQPSHITGRSQIDEAGQQLAQGDMVSFEIAQEGADRFAVALRQVTPDEVSRLRHHDPATEGATRAAMAEASEGPSCDFVRFPGSDLIWARSPRRGLLPGPEDL